MAGLSLLISIDWADPEELEFMGIRDYFAADTPLPGWEWPGDGARLAASPDLRRSHP